MGSLTQWVWLVPLLITTADTAVRWRRIAARTVLSPVYQRLLLGRWVFLSLPWLVIGPGFLSGATLTTYLQAPSTWPVEALFLMLLALGGGVSVWLTHGGGAALLVTHPGIVAVPSALGITVWVNVVLAALSLGLWGRLWHAWAPPAGLPLPLPILWPSPITTSAICRVGSPPRQRRLC